MSNDELDTLDAAEIRYWAEFCAWSALVMTPIIWWLQGPSVSTDQFVVRTALVVISASVAVGLRGRALIQKRRDAKKVKAAHPGDTRHEKPSCENFGT